MRARWMAAILLVACFGGASAEAETLRWPATGRIAFSIELPAGWSFRDEGGSASVDADNHESSLGLFLIDDGGRQNAPLSTLAAEILEAAQSPPYTSAEPGDVGGLDGTIFVSTAKNQNGFEIVQRVMLARIDATHVAAMTDSMVVGGDPSDRPHMDALLSGTRLIGVR